VFSNFKTHQISHGHTIESQEHSYFDNMFEDCKIWLQKSMFE